MDERSDLNTADLQSAGAVGETLRRRRQMKGMSLRQVAEAAEISVGMLSQVERDLAAPSVKTLRAICAAMDMPVSWLFNSADAPPGPEAEYIVRHDARRTLSYQSGRLSKELLSPDTQPKIQMLRFVIKPGGHSGEPYRNEEGGKCGLVLAGTLGVEIDGAGFELQPGDSLTFPATSLVRFWAVGEANCEVIWIVAPATV